MIKIRKFFSKPCPWCKKHIVYFKIDKGSRLFGEGITICPYCKKASKITNIGRAAVITLLSIFILGSIMEKAGLFEYPFRFLSYNFTVDQKTLIICLIYWPIPYIIFHKTIKLVKCLNK